MMITRALSFVAAAILLFQVGAAAQEKAEHGR